MTPLWLLAITIVGITYAAWLHALIPPPFQPLNPSRGTVASRRSSIPNLQWSNLLGNLLWFYDAQRSGVLSPDNRVPWRNDSCVSDGSDAGRNLTGGFYSDGGYLKETFTLSFTLCSLAWSGIDFGRGFDISNQTPYLDRTLRWGLDWLARAHPDPNTLYVQVGDPKIDSNYWGGDQGIPQPRPSFAIRSAAPGTDAAASTAAAFAAASVFYRGSSSLANTAWSGSSRLADSSYANALLAHAKDLFNFATISRSVAYSTSVPQIPSKYTSSGVVDDLVWAAAWLYYATNIRLYLDYAVSVYQSSNLKGSNDVFNWDNKTPGALVLLVELLRSRGQNASMWQRELERYLDIIVSSPRGGKPLWKRTYLTQGGLLFYRIQYTTNSPSDTPMNAAANAAMLLLRYAPLASSTNRSNIYRNFANEQSNYIFGNNPMRRPYIVGVHPNSPVNPRSALASGGNDLQHIDTTPHTTQYVLYGAVVGGPDVNDNYWDQRSRKLQSQVRLDFNAPVVALAAYNVITNPNDPFYVRLSSGAQRPNVQSKKHVLMYISLLAVTLFLAFALGWCCNLYRVRQHNRPFCKLAPEVITEADGDL